MSIQAIVGGQWGDEGKGKIVDFLSEKFDLVARYQGGNNAGHTVIVEDITYKLNLIPSGVIRGKICFLGQGIVLDPEHFIKEYEQICEKISNPKIYLSSNIPLILPYHKQLDKINESILSGEDKIGTTAKGIGPAYQDKVGRKSIKLYDLKSTDKVREKLENIKKFYDPVLNAYQEEPINIDKYISILDSFYTKVGPLIIDNSYIKEIKQKFLDRNIEMPKINQNQAIVLDGADIISNPIGTARGIHYKHLKSNFFIMPGVPSEMYKMMETIILPNYIGAQVESKHRTICTSGIAESRLSEKVQDLMSHYSKDFNFSFLPSYKGVDFILKAINQYQEIDRVVSEFYNAMNPYSFGYENDSFIEFIVNKLSCEELTISLAESCTGGLLGKMFTDIPGSSKIFKGGIIAYSNSIKETQLNIPKEKIEKYGAVSSEVAIDMARNVKNIFKSKIGLSITGISGPGGGSDDKDIGLVFIAIAFKNECLYKEINFNLNRDLNRKSSCYAALNMIRKTIEE